MLKFKMLIGSNLLNAGDAGLANMFKLLKISIAGNMESHRNFHNSTSLNFRRGILHPNGYSFDWAIKAAIPNIDIYTHEPLPRVTTGGRGPNGRVEIKHISGGLRYPVFMVSKFRGGLSNASEPVIAEKVLYIHKNWWRSENIALVARGLNKRWVYATTSMKEGDIIRSYGQSSKLVVRPVPGDAYPVGCLPVGTSICQIERYPGGGVNYAKNAGTQGEIYQKLPDNSCVIKFKKKLIKISSGCSAVVGQMSNPDHYKLKFTKFGQKKWLGIKQSSGLKQKKTGRFGRKIRKMRPPIDFTLTKAHETLEQLTYSRPEFPKLLRKLGTMENPCNVKPLPVEEGKLHPRFKWCGWSSVR